MWLTPQPNDPAQLAFGETYADFAPTPPPIGPVAIDAGAPPCAAGTFTSADGARCYLPRWITFLSGGFDPQYTKGRGVYMVDVGTGQTLWDFAQPAGAASACTDASDPRCHLNFPVASTVSMMIWGDREARQLPAGKRVFDTATFGDTGGQLWVLRFSEPGRIDAGTGKVTNWFGARIFQQGKGAATPECALGFCGAQPFFYGTANVQLLANGSYRVLAGTGDRFNVLDAAGGACGPDNPRACLLKGCSVKLEGAAAGTAGATYGVDGLLGSQAYRMVGNAGCAATDASTFSRTDTPGGGAACTGVTSKIDRYTISCPRAVTCSGQDESTSKITSIECDVAGGAVTCRSRPTNEPGIPIDVKGNPDRRNWYYSVRVFEDAGARKIFKTLAEATAYDAARLSEATLVDINAADAGGSFATADQPGWKYDFDHGGAVAATGVRIGTQDFEIYRNDERVASSTAVEAGCTFFNTLQTATPRDALDDVTMCSVNSPCKAGKAQLSYTYGLHPGTGGKCMYVDGLIARSSTSETLVPPHIGKLVVYASSGQLSFGLTSVRVPQGGSNIALGEVEDIASSAGWLPPDRALHDCRHQPGGGPAPANCK
jgi:type IV pilus assembly protein PilY1